MSATGNIADTVLTEILKGCRTQVRKDHAVEMRLLRKDSAELKKTKATLAKLTKQLTKQTTAKEKQLEKERLEIQKQREWLQDAMRKVVKSADAIVKLKDRKLKNVISEGESWTEPARRQSMAMRAIRRQLSDKVPYKKTKTRTRRKRRDW